MSQFPEVRIYEGRCLPSHHSTGQNVIFVKSHAKPQEMQSGRRTDYLMMNQNFAP